MIEAFVRLLVGFSWVVFFCVGLAGLAGGWLYFGYGGIDCFPMSAEAAAACTRLAEWASDHVLIAERAIIPYRDVLISERDMLIALAVGATATACLIQIIHRVERRRRRRRLGVFADLPGFRPIEKAGDQ